MSRRGTPALFIPLAAVLAVVFPFAFGFRQPVAEHEESGKAKQTATHNQKVVASPKPAEQKTLDKHDARKILQEFFGSNPLPENHCPATIPGGPYCIRFMIATIPDPIDSHLPYLFDRFLGSIQRAAEADHLVMDRYDLPWVEDLEKKRTTKEGDEHSDSTTLNSTETHDYRKEPGIVLFRDALNKNGPRLLVLFIVGETPTAGVHKESFLSSLEQIRTFSLLNKQEQPTIKILGPSFSGSAESMEMALRKWLAEPQQANQIAAGKKLNIQIVSGSATAIPIAPSASVLPVVPDVNAKKERRYFNINNQRGEVKFESTVLPDKVALRLFFRYLNDQRGSSLKRPIRVGLLTEGNTAYGDSLKSYVEDCQKQDMQKPDCTEQEFNAMVVPLPFPVHISRLRSESERMRAQRNQSSQETDQNLSSSKYLSMPFDDESVAAKSSIPTFSNLETPTSELTLANALSTLSREHFDYVGIAATDVRDTIFLVREVREHSPSSVIFSLNADLLYIHPEANPNTRGMLIITPYPLFTLNQRWMDPLERRTRLQFPDQNSEAVYNAMLVLLGTKAPDTETQKPQDRKPGNQQPQDSSPEDELKEFGVPFWRFSIVDPQNPTALPSWPPPEEFRRPPIWITTVGREGFWPVTVLFGRGNSGNTHTRELPTAFKGDRKPPGDRKLPSDWLLGTLPHSTTFVFFLWSMLCGLPALYFLYQEIVRMRTGGSESCRFGSFWGIRPFFECVFTRNLLECRAYLLVGGVAALSAYIVAVAAYAITSLRVPQWNLRSFFLIVMIMIAGMSICSCLLLALETIALLRGPKGSHNSNGYLAIPVLLIGGASLGLAICLATEWVLLRFNLTPVNSLAVNGIVTGYRALSLQSGVSPLLPLFFIVLAACTWAISAIRRVQLTEAFPWKTESRCEDGKDSPCDKDSNSLFNFTSQSFMGFHVLESRVQELLRCPSLHLPGELRPISFAIAGSIFAAGLYLFYFRLVLAFESPTFYLLFGVCFVMVYLSTSFNILRLLFLWLGLSKVLKAMERQRIRGSFSRFHRNYPNLPRINLASAPSPLTALNFCIEQAVALSNCAKPLLPEAETFACKVDGVENLIEKAESCYRTALDAEVEKDRCVSLIAQLKSQRYLAQVSFCVEEALERYWKTNAAAATADEALETKRKKLFEQAEEFLVGRTVLFLSHIFPQMTNLAGFSLASLLLMLFAVSSYPFQPHQLIVLFNWIVIFAFVAVAMFMAVQMNRDTVLSRLNGSKPGELSWDREFITRIFLYVVLPLLGFLGVQFPEAFSRVFSFLSLGTGGHG